VIIVVNLEQARGTTEGEKNIADAISWAKVQQEEGKERRKEETSSSSQKRKTKIYYVSYRGERIPLTLDIESLLIVRPS